MANEQPHRVALYWAPRPDDALWRTGSHWLGRDAANGQRLKQPAVEGVEPALFDALTADPRRYGWHATLKPPFRMADGVTLDQVDEATERLARSWRVTALPPLRVASLGRFLALRPQGPMDTVNQMAADCVRRLHALARPQSSEELARRRHPAMTARQNDLLQRWGYPWVLEEFRFHCSLTGPLAALDEPQTASVTAAARRLFDVLPAPTMDSVALFVEPVPGGDFRLHRHWSLSA